MVQLSVHGKAAKYPTKWGKFLKREGEGKLSFSKERLSVEGEAAENPIKSSCVKERWGKFLKREREGKVRRIVENWKGKGKTGRKGRVKASKIESSNTAVIFVRFFSSRCCLKYI